MPGTNNFPQIIHYTFTEGFAIVRTGIGHSKQPLFPVNEANSFISYKQELWFVVDKPRMGFG
jgi:hypothetical protein